MKIYRMLAIASLLSVSPLHAATIRENFTTDPVLAGWQELGETNLFQWDSTNQVLDVTWDSTQPNSFFYYPLGQTYTMADGFYIQFDLQFSDAMAYDYGMQAAIGLLHFMDATNADFSRSDLTAPNVCEFDYFPAINFGGYAVPDNVEATLVDMTATNFFWDEDFLTLSPGMTYRVGLVHQPGAGGIQCTISTTNGQMISSLPIVQSYNNPVGGFQLDMLSVTSYEDDGYGDSILAHGTVGNMAFASPLPVAGIVAPAAGQAEFASDTNWVYVLQESVDLQNWTSASVVARGNGTNLLLQATNSPPDNAYYRVVAQLP